MDEGGQFFFFFFFYQDKNIESIIFLLKARLNLRKADMIGQFRSISNIRSFG